MYLHTENEAARVKVSETPGAGNPHFFALENDTKYHERCKYEEIIWWKAEIFSLHKVLIRHDRT